MTPWTQPLGPVSPVCAGEKTGLLHLGTHRWPQCPSCRNTFRAHPVTWWTEVAFCARRPHRVIRHRLLAGRVPWGPVGRPPQARHLFGEAGLCLEQPCPLFLCISGNRPLKDTVTTSRGNPSCNRTPAWRPPTPTSDAEGKLHAAVLQSV